MIGRLRTAFSTPVPPSKAWAAILLTWTAVILAVSTILDTNDTRVLLPALLACVGVFGVWRPVPFAGIVMGVLAALAYAGSVTLLRPANVIPLIVLGVVSSLGLGFLADSAARFAEAEDGRRRQDERLLEQLTFTESETGALKWYQALHALAEEIIRARRHRYAIVLAFVEISSAAEDIPIQPDGESPVARVTRLFMSRLRTSDRVGRYLTGELALILPHTPLDGALRTVEKLRIACQDGLNLDIRAGLVEFPTDAGTVDELVKEGLAALESARGLGIPVASRALLAPPM